MIQKFVDRFINNKNFLKEKWSKQKPNGYDDIFTEVIKLVSDPDDYYGPDPERITVIDHGDYQGTQLFIVGAKGYQPSTYWSCFVSYGSCGGCDTYQAICDDIGWGSEEIPETAVNDFLSLALHMVENLKEI